MRIFGFWQKIFGLCEQNNALYHKFVGYISNNIFPPLLTAEEEAEAISLAASGDDTARRKLIEHNLRLVAHICRKYESTGIEKDDLISLGTIGLIKGVNTFRPDKGSRLSTYAARCIDNAILSQMRLWFRINPPRAEKHQNGVLWHRFPKMSTSFVPLRTAM